MKKNAKIAIEAVGLGKKLHYLSNQISGGEKPKSSYCSGSCL